MFKVCELCDEFRYFSKPHKLDCDMCEAVINYEIKNVLKGHYAQKKTKGK